MNDGEALSRNEHEEIESLLGVYALDACDPEAASLVGRHLEGCVRCALEVAGHHEVAALLANSGGEAPPQVWEGIAARLEADAPPPWRRLAERLGTGEEGRTGAVDMSADMEDTGHHSISRDSASRRGGSRLGTGSDGGLNPPVDLAARRRHRLGHWVAAVGVAAAAVVAIAFGVRSVHSDHPNAVGPTMPLLNAAEQAAMALPSSAKVQLTSAVGATGSNPISKVLVVLTSTGTGFVVSEHLTPLPAGRTYQLWGVIDQKTISLGLLGRHPTVVPFSVGGVHTVSAFAITNERSGGVVQSVNRPVVAGQVPA